MAAALRLPLLALLLTLPTALPTEDDGFQARVAELSERVKQLSATQQTLVSRAAHLNFQTIDLAGQTEAEEVNKETNDRIVTHIQKYYMTGEQPLTRPMSSHSLKNLSPVTSVTRSRALVVV